MHIAQVTQPNVEK